MDKEVYKQELIRNIIKRLRYETKNEHQPLYKKLSNQIDKVNFEIWLNSKGKPTILLSETICNARNTTINRKHEYPTGNLINEGDEMLLGFYLDQNYTIEQLEKVVFECVI